MADLHFTETINASREHVWDTMLNDATYREWTSVFAEGSYYKGDWSEGSEIIFTGPDQGQGEGGMVGTIRKNTPHEFVSIEYQKEMSNGETKELPPGSFENYAFADADGGTLLTIDLTNVPDEYAPMFTEMWPMALQKLKEIAER